MTDRTLYLSGFGAFPGVDDNPTARVASLLDGQTFGDYRVVSEILTVSFDRAPAEVLKSLGHHRPDLVVHLGVACGSGRIRVESVGVNEMASAMTDVDGIFHDNSPIDALQPIGEVRETTLPVDDLVRLLEGAGFPASRSDDAGRYVCNCVYFSTLNHLHGSEIPALFLHLPEIGEDVEGRPPWDLVRLTGAVRTILERLVALQTG
jgi:pyroglutamyl-peptidase